MLGAGVISSGQLWPAVNLIAKHPKALISIFTLSLSATVGESSANSASPLCSRFLRWHASLSVHSAADVVLDNPVRD